VIFLFGIDGATVTADCVVAAVVVDYVVVVKCV